ncbi:MAG: hypothetical protein HC840_18195 [Leptolyngbyaceae cyanobacterium RM2_2_4]|nr:hypothetical protein [Leptolyngbyaceae cyanobacterium RM2_2_4]
MRSHTSLTPEQERFIQTKLQAGKYRSVEEILEVAPAIEVSNSTLSSMLRISIERFLGRSLSW